VRYTVLLTPDNNHFVELGALDRAGLIARHPASTPSHPIYVPARTLMRKDYVPELRALFGERFDNLSHFHKEVLSVLYRFDRFSRSAAVSAKEASFELWAARGGEDDIRAFDAFYRKTRRAFNELEEANLVFKKARTHGFGLVPPAKRQTSRRPKAKSRATIRRRAATGQKAYKDLAAKFFLEQEGPHAVDEIRAAIGLPNSVKGRNQARNILVRLHNDGTIRRVRFGIYRREPTK
jgi:hypothetical protein